MPAASHLHLIAYSEETLAQIGPGWQVLDNRANARPDWFEYWPIREWFAAAPALDEAAYYGFFSPKFERKTGLNHAATTAFIAERAQGADAVLFSPQPDMGAFFLSVFEQAEVFDAGFIAATEALLTHAGITHAPLAQLVMDTRHIVYSNYFAARPAFWRRWLAVNGALFDACEGGAPEALRTQLTASTSYPGPNGGTERKVFIQERMASLLLATEPWRAVACNPFDMAWSATRLHDYPVEAYVCDALKMAWREQPFGQYLQAFSVLRQRVQSGQAALERGG